MAGFRTFLKSGHAPTLFAAFLYFDFCFAVWVLNGAMAPFISEAYHLSAAQKGFMVSVPTLAVRNEREIVGYCFTPQDGNSLLSSVAGATWFLYPENYEDRIQCLKPYFYPEV